MCGPEGAKERVSGSIPQRMNLKLGRCTLGPKTRASLPPPIGGTMNKISAGTLPDWHRGLDGDPKTSQALPSTIRDDRGFG